MNKERATNERETQFRTRNSAAPCLVRLKQARNVRKCGSIIRIERVDARGEITLYFSIPCSSALTDAHYFSELDQPI